MSAVIRRPCPRASSIRWISVSSLGQFRRPEFGLISRWHLTEKVDGTNVRVHWNPKDERHGDWGFGEPRPRNPAGKVTFGGRTDNTQMPLFLLDHLVETFTPDKFTAAFEGDVQVTLYGEGYWGKIQKGGNYRKDASFRLFDVLVHGCEHHRAIWLQPGDVVDVAGKLGINTVPVLGARIDTAQAVGVVKAGLVSPTAQCDGGNMEYMQEGIVARAPMGLLNRLGGRVMWKLKAKDFA